MTRNCEVNKNTEATDESNKIRIKDVRKCLTALNPADVFHILMLQASFTGYEFFPVLKTDWAGHPIVYEGIMASSFGAARECVNAICSHELSEGRYPHQRTSSIHT